VILYRWHGASSNFGDELNTILWPRLLPGFFDQDPAIRFLGIGSVLDQRHSSQVIKLVAGSGYGGYERKPHLDENWIIHWVRGPRTAAALGLAAELALGDPAVLVPKAMHVATPEGRDIGFMPHFESAAWGDWEQAADLAGVRLIDPRGPPFAILQAIGRCKLLLSEALHGVIVADALRVPWIAIRPSARVHRAKWRDWAETMDLRPRFLDLPASTLAEWVGTSKLGLFHPTRVWLRRQECPLKQITPQRPVTPEPAVTPEPLVMLEHPVLQERAVTPERAGTSERPGTSERLVTRAGNALRLAASASPQLSADTTLDRCQSRMLDAVHSVRMNPLRGKPPVAPLVHLRSCLQASDDSAYQLALIG